VENLDRSAGLVGLERTRGFAAPRTRRPVLLRLKWPAQRRAPMTPHAFPHDRSGGRIELGLPALTQPGPDRAELLWIASRRGSGLGRPAGTGLLLPGNTTVSNDCQLSRAGRSGARQQLTPRRQQSTPPAKCQCEAGRALVTLPLRHRLMTDGRSRSSTACSSRGVKVNNELPGDQARSTIPGLGRRNQPPVLASRPLPSRSSQCALKTPPRVRRRRR